MTRRRAADGGSGRILFFGSYDTAAHPRVAVLRDGLAATAEVVEVNVGLALSTAQRVRMLQDPRRLPLLMWRILVCWLGLLVQVRRLRRGGAVFDAVVVGYLGHFDVLLARRLFRGVPVVLDFLVGAGDTAADRGVSSGWRQSALRRLDLAALRAADVVVVDTDEHLELLPPAFQGRAVVVPVGASETWSHAAAARERAQSDGSGAGVVRAVFFGLFTPLQGAPVIGQALAQLTGETIEVTMIGTGQDYDETRAIAAVNPRVVWIDWVEKDELPDLVAAHDICLGIFGTGPKALRVVPTKIFQGAAAGCALVTSDTRPQRRVLDHAGRYVAPGDAEALAGELRGLAADPARLQRARRESRMLAERRFRPATVVAPLRARLAEIIKEA